MSGPSDKAVTYACGGAPATRKQMQEFVRLHEPALGLDRSVCLRDVVEALLEWERTLPDVRNAAQVADFIEREFGDT